MFKMPMAFVVVTPPIRKVWATVRITQVHTVQRFITQVHTVQRCITQVHTVQR